MEEVVDMEGEVLMEEVEGMESTVVGDMEEEVGDSSRTLRGSLQGCHLMLVGNL